MNKIRKIQVVKSLGWLDGAVEVMKKTPMKQFEKLPMLSVQPDVAIAVKCLGEPRETNAKGKDFAFLDVELIEPAIVYENQAEHEAPAGTKASMNLKRHSSLWRIFSKNFLPADGKEVVIANLGKREFKDKEGKLRKGYDYRIMNLADLKEKMATPKQKKK